MIRSISFDIRSLEGEKNPSIAELVGAVSADLQSSARNLCERNEARLRSATWDASQATEKALKLLFGEKDRRHLIATIFLNWQIKQRLWALRVIDRTKLSLIPSGHDATSIRYGGDMTLSKAIDAYDAALSSSDKLSSKPNLTPNTICARRGSKFDVHLGSTLTQTRLARNCAQRSRLVRRRRISG